MILERISKNGISLLVDPGARDRGVLVAFANRHGGVGTGPYASLNLAARVGDDPAAVEENRRRVAEAADFDADGLVLARQVHAADVFEAKAGSRGVVGDYDALVTRTPGPVLGILTADCAPVAIAGERGVALCHAGWRGLVAGVVERGVDAVGRPWGAWIGPCIRACCYVVGPEVVDAFARRGLPVVGDGRVDPSDAARAVLKRCGVTEVAAAPECTSCDRAYFSYRRDGITGRQGTFAALIES